MLAHAVKDFSVKAVSVDASLQDKPDLTRIHACVTQIHQQSTLMKDPITRRIAPCLMAGLAALTCLPAAAAPTHLRCEYLTKPLGIDVENPRLSWVIENPKSKIQNPKSDIPRGQKQTAYQILVASTPARLAQDQGDLWDSGKVASDQSAQLAYAGKALTSRQQCFWKVGVWMETPAANAKPSWSQPAMWEMGLLKPEDWQAKWINAEVGKEAAASVPILRKNLKLANKPLAKARLYITALGLYQMHLNGRRVGDLLFAPEWTDYRKRIRYQVYDVTDMLAQGDNVLAGLVGQGWYSGHIGLGGYKHYGQIPALLAQLEVTYNDGSTAQILSDASWKISASPILASDFMMGENYDARLEVKGWNELGLDDSNWQPATVREESPRPLQSQVTEPVRKICEIAAKTITEPKPACWTFDLGQNLVGYVRLKVAAPAGTKLTLRHAEILNPDGTLYTTNLRSAASIDTYICKGGGVEIFQPNFTFHGFRYVEITGLPAKPALDAITGIVIASDTPRAGEFACSDPRVNQLYSNICWGQRGNYLSIPTDCPQRDERLGWMGDAQVFVRTATYNSDVAAFFTKWLVDVDDAQCDGAFTDVSPNTAAGAGTPAWADAGVICPWTIYQVYGDARQLEAHYPAMARWIEWCRAHSTELIRDKDRGGDYGDWLSIGADTPKDLIGTAYFAYSSRLVAQAAKVLGKNEDAAKYEQLFQDIKTAFNKKYVAADGRIQGNTQCCYAMALKFGLLSDEMRAKAVDYLVEDITAKTNHLSTGFVGVSYLLPVLTQAGKLDTVFKLFLQDTFPSWLFSVKHGATTIWERWDGWTPEKGFQDPGMNSFNHYSLGSCGEWMFSSLAGIDTDGPGFRNLMIRPTPGHGINWVKASYDSINGRIATSWKMAGDTFSLDVTIPPNTTATVYVPAIDAASVKESGKPAADAAGLKFLRMDHGTAVYAAGSGSYAFTSKRLTAE
jgi:alpha-L-rhamnosidase